MFSSPILIAAKLFLGSAWKFIKKNWLPVLFAALLLTILFLYAKLDRVQFEYDQHLIADAKAFNDRKAENEAKEYRHQVAIEEAHAETVILTEKFNLDRDRYTKELKDLYDAKKNSDLNSTFRLNSYADWVQLERQRKTTAGLPTPEADTEALTSGWRNCDRAFNTLEQACRITTIDYNELRKWADSACNTVGCK